MTRFSTASVLNPTLRQTLDCIAEEIRYSFNNGHIDATVLISSLLLVKDSTSAIKLAFSKTRSILSLTLLTHTFIRELSHDDDALLVLISEIGFVTRGERPRESTGAILELTSEQKIGLIWHILLGDEADQRFDMLSECAINTRDSKLAAELVAYHANRIPKPWLLSMLDIGMKAA